MMSDADHRYRVQHDRICNILIGQMGMKVYFEQKDRPHQVSFKVFGAEGAVRMTAFVEELEHMSDGEIATRIRAKMCRP